MYAIHTLAPRAQIYVFLYNCIQIYKICQSFIKVFYYTKVTILPALFTNPYCIAGLLHTKRERKQFCHSHSLSQRYLIYFTLFTVRVHLSDHFFFTPFSVIIVPAAVITYKHILTALPHLLKLFHPHQASYMRILYGFYLS